MADNYAPSPYVRPAYVPDTRTLADLLRLSSQAKQQAILQRGQTSGQGYLALGALISNALGSIREGRQTAEAHAAQQAFNQQKLAQEQQDKERDFALRAAQFQSGEAQRQAMEDRLGRQDTRLAANDAVENTLPGPIDPTSAQTLRAYPGTAPLVSSQSELPARPVSPEMPPMAPPSQFDVRGTTPKEATQAAAAAQAAKLAEAAALRQAAMDKRQALMDANTIRHQNVMENRPVGGTSAKPDAVAMSPGSIDEAAHRVRLYGPQSIPTRFDDNDKKRILNRESEINKAMGNSPLMAVLKQASQKSDQKSLDTITKLSDSIAMSENKASQQAELVRGVSKQVKRTDYPIINDWLVSGKAALGNTPAHLLGNALITFTNEYAKIVEGSTASAAGASVSARQAAEGLISKALSEGTLDATLNQMQKEMKIAADASRVTKDDIMSRMSGQPQAAPVAPSVFSVVAPDGKTYSFKTAEALAAFKSRAGIQ